MMKTQTQTAAGRKSDYSEQILVKAETYLTNHADVDDLVPSVSGLAVYLNKARSTIYSWAKDDDKKPFSDLLEILLAKQEKMLLNGGLSGTFNASITKLMLSKHDYSEKKTEVVDYRDLTPWSSIEVSEDKMTKRDFNDFYAQLEADC